MKGQWKRVLRYSFSGLLVLIGCLNLLVGSAWYLALGVAVAGGIIFMGQRRIFRAGVTRTTEKIVCRYIPWYEGNAYTATVLVPLMGVTSLGAGFAPGNPGWLRFTGVVLMGVTPLTLYGVVRMWRRCLLCINPATLTVRLVERKSSLTEIRREQIESMEPKLIAQPAGGASQQVVITYHPANCSSGSATVTLGLRLTVQPTNLFNALVAWKDGGHDDPAELLDRIERILRGQSAAGV